MEEQHQACSTFFEDLWNRRAQFPPGNYRAEVRNLQEWCARLSAEEKQEDTTQDQPQEIQRVSSRRR